MTQLETAKMKETSAKKMKFRALVVAMSVCLASGASLPIVAGAAPELVIIKSDEKWPSPRWMYGKGDMPKVGAGKGDEGAVAALAAVKQAQLAGEWDTCLNREASARAKSKSLQPWLATVEIECAIRVKSSVASANRLSQALSRAESHPSWMLKGPQAPSLRAAFIKGHLTLVEQDLKTNRARAWKSVESLREFHPYMDQKEKSRLWRHAGELSFVQQKTDAARDFFRRSLAEEGSDEVKQRLDALEKLASGAKVSADSAPAGASAPPAVEVSREELELVERVTTALKAGDLVPAVEDAVRIIREFPGSQRANWASERVLDVYLSFVEKNDPKFAHLRHRVFSSLEKADAERVVEWSRFMFGRGYFADSFELAKKALPGLSGARLTAALDLGAKAALASDQLAAAKEMSAELILKHSGTAAAREAILRSGLINYRQGQFPQAVSDFEKIIAIPQVETLEVIARHWMWRSLQKMKSERADAAADELMAKFPFSYYGLRARMERSNQVLEWKPEETKAESRLWLTAPERLAWDRFQLLLRAGWLDEAQAELRELPEPVRAEDRAVRALLLASSGQYLRASQLANQAWDEKSNFRSAPFMAAAFPMEFDAWIEENTARRKVDRHLVRGLIKQESGYNLKAVSRSNALGLMQIIPPTAKEIAVDLKLGPINFPDDLFEPRRNIQMGTYYISRLTSKYQGHIPLALAAYNAGQGKVDRWLRARPSLKNLAGSKSSDPDDEIWFDEFPYAETSFYIKAILRNILIYRMLDQGRVEKREPLWASE
jgi:soluble lytic murein transglycosylase